MLIEKWDGDDITPGLVSRGRGRGLMADRTSANISKHSYFEDYTQLNSSKEGAMNDSDNWFYFISNQVWIYNK